MIEDATKTDLRGEIGELHGSPQPIGATSPSATDGIEERLDQLVEQVTALANSSSTAWFNDFATTLVATVVGASFAGALTVLVFRSERKERYEVALVSHVEELSIVLLAWARAHSEHLHGLKNGGRADPPDRTKLDIALNALIARTRDDDRAVAEQLRSVVYEQSFIGDPLWVVPECASIQRVANAWCARSVTALDTTAALRVFDERRARKEDDPLEPRASIEPPAPMPYERASGLDERLSKPVPRPTAAISLGAGTVAAD